MPYDYVAIDDDVFRSDGCILQTEDVFTLCVTIYPGDEYQSQREWAEKSLLWFIEKGGQAVVEKDAAPRKLYPFPLMSSSSRVHRSEAEEDDMESTHWSELNCVANVLVLMALIDTRGSPTHLVAMRRLNELAKKKKSPFKASCCVFTSKGIEVVWPRLSALSFTGNLSQLVALWFSRETRDFFFAVRKRVWCHLDCLHLAFYLEEDSETPESPERVTRGLEALRFLREDVTVPLVKKSLPSYARENWLATKTKNVDHIDDEISVVIEVDEDDQKEQTELTLCLEFLASGPLRPGQESQAWVGENFLSLLPPWPWKGRSYELKQAAGRVLRSIHHRQVLDRVFEHPIIVIHSDHPDPAPETFRTLLRNNYEQKTLIWYALQAFTTSPIPWQWLQQFLIDCPAMWKGKPDTRDYPFSDYEWVDIWKTRPDSDHPVWTLPEVLPLLTERHVKIQNFISFLFDWILVEANLPAQDDSDAIQRMIRVLETHFNETSDGARSLILMICLCGAPSDEHEAKKQSHLQPLLLQMASRLLDQKVQWPILDPLPNLHSWDSLNTPLDPSFQDVPSFVIHLINVFLSTKYPTPSSALASWRLKIILFLVSRFGSFMTPSQFIPLIPHLFAVAGGFEFLQTWAESLQRETEEKDTSEKVNNLKRKLSHTSSTHPVLELWNLLLGEIDLRLRDGRLAEDDPILSFVLEGPCSKEIQDDNVELPFVIDKTLLLRLPRPLLTRLIPDDFSLPISLPKRQRC